MLARRASAKSFKRNCLRSAFKAGGLLKGFKKPPRKCLARWRNLHHEAKWNEPRKKREMERSLHHSDTPIHCKQVPTLTGSLGPSKKLSWVGAFGTMLQLQKAALQEAVTTSILNSRDCAGSCYARNSLRALSSGHLAETKLACR